MQYIIICGIYGSGATLEVVLDKEHSLVETVNDFYWTKYKTPEHYQMKKSLTRINYKWHINVVYTK